MQTPLLTIVPALIALSVAAASAAPAIPAAPRALLDKYCADCHDDTTAKAKLSLERLPADFRDPRWVRVHDKLAGGEMPPPKKPQPTPAERAQLTQWLSQELVTASAARQKSEGRVVLRRMNRTEYEHTLHDLLGISVPLAQLLPEDNSIAGFDSVSTGLETSATHLVRYQTAADAALAAALPGRPIKSITVRHTGRAYLEGRLPVHRVGIDPYVRVAGDALVLHALVYGDMSMQAPRPPMAGRYRVRASVHTVGMEGKSMRVTIAKRVDRFAVEKLQHLVDIVDLPAGQTRIIEAEAFLDSPGQFLYFEGSGLPFFVEMKKARNGAPVGNDFAGPGLAFDWAELEGPLGVETGYQRLFGDLPQLPTRVVDDLAAGKPDNTKWRDLPPTDGQFANWPLVPVPREPKADANRLIRDFLPRAFRRPVDEELAAHYVALVHQQLDAGEKFPDAMRAGYRAILCSPHFLYYLEKPGRLDAYDLAARLARFLWKTLPDEPLLAAAAQGKLTEPSVLRAQTERMLADPRAQRFTRDFTDQWLGVGKILEMKPDPIYTEYDDLLAWSMPLETRRFFEEVLTHDLPTTSFLTSDWTFLNERLAQHYGIGGVDGIELRRVTLPPGSHRGGVITHASVLKMSTNATYTSPVKRGVWLLDRIIGKTPPPPPPDVKAAEPDIRGATTIREQLDKHKSEAVCAACHMHIDPPGFALENFDVLGGWREFYRVKTPPPTGGRRADLVNYPGKPVWLAKAVDAQGETDDGKPFTDIDEYKKLVLRDPDQLTRNLAEKLIIYSTGATIQFADRAVVEQIVRDVKARQYGFRVLIHAIIQSPVFLNK